MKRQIIYLENGQLSLWTADRSTAHCTGEVQLDACSDDALREFLASHLTRRIGLVTHDENPQQALESLPTLGKRERRQLARLRCMKRFPEGDGKMHEIIGHPERILLSGWRASSAEQRCSRELRGMGGRLLSRHASSRLLGYLLPAQASGMVLSAHNHGCQLALAWRGQIVHRQQLAHPIDPDAWREGLQLITQQAAMLGETTDAHWQIDGAQVQQLAGLPEIARAAQLADCTPRLLALVGSMPRSENYLVGGMAQRRTIWLAGSLGVLASALAGVNMDSFGNSIRPQAPATPTAAEAIRPPPEQSPAAPSQTASPETPSILHGEIRFTDGRRTLLAEQTANQHELSRLLPGDSSAAPLLPAGSLRIHRAPEAAR